MTGLPPLSAPVLDWIRRAEELSEQLPDLGSTDLSARRRAAHELSDRLAVEFMEPAPAGIDVQDLHLTRGLRRLRARRYRAADAGGALPTMLWLHGGGWIGGTIDEIVNDRLCADRALRSGVQMISLEYGLAPERPFPAAVEDATAALADLRLRSEEIGIDASRLGIGGNSAGATIAASAALRERDAGRPLLHQTLEVLPAALRPIGTSFERHRRASGMIGAEQLTEQYRAGAPMSEASPLDAPDHRALAPALILVAEFDPLRDGAIAYAHALEAAGVPVVLRIGEGHVHGSPGITRWQGARDWRDTLVAEVAAAYSVPHSPTTRPDWRR